MDRIVISGQCSGVGKTSFLEEIIPSLYGKIVVIKCAVSENIDSPIISSEEDKNLNSAKDTGRFLKAGAEQAIYLKTDYRHFGQNLEKAHNLSKDADYILYEGNNILDFINSDLIIYLKNDGLSKKPSAQKAEKKSDIIIAAKDKENFVDDAIFFNQKSISCYKAHLFAKIMAISVAKVGKMLNQQQIKIKGCQLGLF